MKSFTDKKGVVFVEKPDGGRPCEGCQLGPRGGESCKSAPHCFGIIWVKPDAWLPPVPKGFSAWIECTPGVVPKLGKDAVVGRLFACERYSKNYIHAPVNSEHLYAEDWAEIAAYCIKLEEPKPWLPPVPAGYSDWVEHSGGAMPVPNNAMVHVLYEFERKERRFHASERAAGVCDWLHTPNTALNIVAYCVKLESEKPWTPPVPKGFSPWIECHGKNPGLVEGVEYQVLTDGERKGQRYTKTIFRSLPSKWGHVVAYCTKLPAPTHPPLLKFDPATGEPNPYPSEAAQYRAHHGAVAWLFNPYTGERRDPRDIGSDVLGVLVVAP